MYRKVTFYKTIDEIEICKERMKEFLNRGDKNGK